MSSLPDGFILQTMFDHMVVSRASKEENGSIQSSRVLGSISLLPYSIHQTSHRTSQDPREKNWITYWWNELKRHTAGTRQREDQSFLLSPFHRISFSQLMLYFTIPYLFCLQYAILSLVCRWILGSKWHLGPLFKLVFNKLWLNKFPRKQ